MPSSTRTRKVELRRRQIAKLYKKGITNQLQIGEIVGASRVTVCKDLKVLNERWKEITLIDLDVAKGKLLDELNDLKHNYWEAWEQSKEEAKTKTIKAKSNNTGQPLPSTQTLRTEDQCGDPRYLQGIEKCLQETAKILGLYAPQKMQHSGDKDNPVIFYLPKNDRNYDNGDTRE